MYKNTNSRCDNLRIALISLAPVVLLFRNGLGSGWLDDSLFVPIALTATIILALSRLSSDNCVDPGGTAVSRSLEAICWLMLGISALFGSTPCRGIALVFALATLAWDSGGHARIKALLPALGIAGICLAWPFELTQWIAGVFTSLAARWSSHLLDLIGVANNWTDSTVEHLGGCLDMSPVFSGLHSPTSLATAVMIYAFARHRGLLRTLVLTSSAVAISLPVAAGLVAFLLWAEWPSLLIKSAWIRAAVVYWSSFAFALCLDQILSIPSDLAVHAVDPHEGVDLELPPEPVLQNRSCWRTVVPTAVCFFLVLGLELASQSSPITPNHQEPSLELPPRIGDWFHISDNAGLNQFRQGRMIARFAIVGGPETPDCISARGRDGIRINDLEDFVADAPNVTRMALRCVQVERRSSGYTTYWIAGRTHGKSWVSREQSTTMIERIRERFGHPDELGSGRVAWWVLLSIGSVLPLDERQRNMGESLFRQLCPLLESKLDVSATGGP